MFQPAGNSIVQVGDLCGDVLSQGRASPDHNQRRLWESGVYGIAGHGPCVDITSQGGRTSRPNL